MSVNSLPQSAAERAIFAMARALEGIPGLRVFTHDPGTINPPAVVFVSPQEMGQGEALHPRPGVGMWRWRIAMEVVGPRSSERESQFVLLRYADAAIERIMPLAGTEAVCHCFVLFRGEIRPLQIGGGSYWSSQVVWETWA